MYYHTIILSIVLNYNTPVCKSVYVKSFVLLSSCVLCTSFFVFSYHIPGTVNRTWITATLYFHWALFPFFRCPLLGLYCAALL